MAGGEAGDGRTNMSVLDLMKARCSIRAYRADPVEEAKLLAVLEAGRLAPSACNNQPWRFVVVREAAMRARMKAVYGYRWFYEAPVIIAVCCQVDEAWVRRKDGKRYGDVDCAIAADHMTLCAQELGLGTCWVCAFDPSAAREVLDLPEGVEPLALLPLGYPAEVGRPKERKKLSEIVHRERFGNR
jgi:nitroreductase